MVPWASFPEPSGPWSVAGFGADAALLTLDPAARGVVRAISPAASEPGAPVALAPPGFAARRWVHLPILGILSIALVLAALIFGTGGYADRQASAPRYRQAVEAARAELASNSDSVDHSIDFPSPLAFRPRGAGLAERGAAFAIDLLPGVLVAWLLEGGNPLDLVQIPLFVTDVERAMPALVALAIGWTLASAGDIVFGRSLGKRLLGLRIVAATSGSPATLGARCLRALLSLIAVASPVVMLLATLHPYGDGPAEMLSRTAVVPESVPTPGPQGTEGDESGGE